MHSDSQLQWKSSLSLAVRHENIIKFRICLQGEVLSPMATDDEDLARQQYESSGRKKKKHKKDRDKSGVLCVSWNGRQTDASKDHRSGKNRNHALNNPIPCCFPRDYNLSELSSMEKT